MMIDSITRRTALTRLTLTAATATVVPCRQPARGETSGDLKVTVLLDEPIGTIQPALYSQFAEHIGGVIYDGIWVGPESKIPNIDGIRRDADRARPPARAGRRALAGRLLRRQVPLARRHRPARRSARAGSAAGARRPSPTSSARTSSSASAGSAASSPISPPTSAPARPRNFSSGSSIATRRPGRPPWPTNARPTASASRSASATGASATRAGAAAASSSPKIIAANTAGSPNGCPQYGVPALPDRRRPQRQQHSSGPAASSPAGPTAPRAPIHGWAPHYYCGTTGHALKFTTTSGTSSFTRPTTWRR